MDHLLTSAWDIGTPLPIFRTLSTLHGEIHIYTPPVLYWSLTHDTDQSDLNLPNLSGIILIIVYTWQHGAFSEINKRHDRHPG